MAIAFDAASSGSTVSPSTSMSWSHTCTGIERLLYFGGNLNTETITGVTYNGVALTAISSQTYGLAQISDWYLIAPATGTHTLTATFSNTAQGNGGAVSLTGVNQVNPLDSSNAATGTGTTATVTVTTIANDAWVLDVVGNTAVLATLSTSGPQTSRWNVGSVSGNSAGGSYGPRSPAGAVTPSWTLNSSADWGHLAASFSNHSDDCKSQPIFFQ